MAVTDHFRKQHAELAEIVRKIEVLLVPATLAANPSSVQPLLIALLGKLTIHLAMEDNSLYPRLKKNGTPELSAMADRFIAEIANTKPVVTENGRKWTG